MAITSSTGVSTTKSCVRRAARHPSDMPRKQASRMVLVKKVRSSTCAGNQRIQASSRKRISTLIRNSSARARDCDRASCLVSKTALISVATIAPPEGEQKNRSRRHR